MADYKHKFTEITEKDWIFDDKWDEAIKFFINVHTKQMAVFKRNYGAGCGCETFRHYGELIAYRASLIMGIRACKVELAKISRHTRTECFDYGCISYYGTQEDEKFANAETIMKEYEPKTLENILLGIESYAKSIGIEDKEKIQNLKQEFIDMMVFDCALGNHDRGLNNWMLLINKSHTDIHIYPMFDNETILMFDIDKKTFEKYYNNLKRSQIVVFPKSKQKIEVPDPKETVEGFLQNVETAIILDNSKKRGTFSELLSYLAEHYPNETKKSIKKVKKFTQKDLIEVMNQCEGLDSRMKEIALRAYEIRMQNIFSVDKYLKESTHIIEPRI